jgi:tetratricopeptide (TPR) repeat protein
MLKNIVSAFAVLLAIVGFAEAQEQRRIALVVGQGAYTSLTELANPKLDARRMAALLTGHGFDVIACDGRTPGCFDLTRAGLIAALARLETKAKGAALAIVYFAGHGMEVAEGNILAPVDAGVDCKTWTVTHGVPVEQILNAVAPAKRKILVLDACRDNPLGLLCPPLKDANKLAFKKIEARDMRGLLLVTSAQFGQQALDGLPDTHSPFAAALFAALEANPNIYFEQVMNEVARVTYETAQKQAGFSQIPGKVVGGEAPADCLAGVSCIGDARVAALAVENDRLASEAAGVRKLLTDEEAVRGKPYTSEERQRRITELEQTLRSLNVSADPVRQEARRLIAQGKVSDGRTMLEAALRTDEREIAQAERGGDLGRAAARRRQAARSARDLATLARGTNAYEAMVFYRRATSLDTSDPETWNDYANAARNAGLTNDAKAAFEQAVAKARAANDPQRQYWAMLGLGDIARDQGSLADALRHYHSAAAIGEPIAKAHPADTRWRRDMSVSQEKIGEILHDQGNLPAALVSLRAALAIREQLAKADPGNADWQRNLSAVHEKIGDVLIDQGNLPAALASHEAALDIDNRLVKADPGNITWQRNLSVAHEKVGDVLQTQGNLRAALARQETALALRARLAKVDPNNTDVQRDLSVSQERIGALFEAQGNLAAALAGHQAALAIRERLVKADPDNTGWQRDLSVAQEKVGDVLRTQGILPAALANYQACLGIRDRLAKADPSNAEWQRDLSISHERIGDVLRAQGNLPGALASQQAGLAIVDRLAKSSPNNGAWQRDLWVSRNKVGEIYLDQGNAAKALVEHQAARNIVERLTASDPSNAGWLRDLSISQNLIGHALLAQGNLAAALKSYRESLSIRERLAKADPNNAQWQYDLAASQEYVGDILLAEGQYAASQSYYQRRHAISRALAESDPLNARWQFNMVESLLRLAIADVLLAQGADKTTTELARRFIVAVALPAESDMQKRVELASAIFKLAKRAEPATTYLQEAREILRRELAAQHLSERQKQWFTTIESALTALPK